MWKSVCAAALLAASITPALAADDGAAIIALERAALDRSDKGDVEGFLEISAPDVVYMDPSLDKPLIGLPALTAYYANANFPRDDAAPRGKMTDAKVQMLGDVAVLSFHYLSGPGSKRPISWNATEVYRKTGNTWLIVNTHWSLTQPQPKD